MASSDRDIDEGDTGGLGIGRYVLCHSGAEVIEISNDEQGGDVIAVSSVETEQGEASDEGDSSYKTDMVSGESRRSGSSRRSDGVAAKDGEEIQCDEGGFKSDEHSLHRMYYLFLLL